MRPSVNAIYIAEGFADDCDDLIQKCLQTETVNFQIFCNIWKDSKFALIFQGRASGAETAELSEEFIQIAKRCMIRNTSNFEESVAGLFLVYALVHTQPYQNFAKLRITPEDLSAINMIKDIARAQKRYDVLCILGSLLIEGPVEYHLCKREYGLENALRKGFILSASIDSLGVRPKGVFYRQNEELDLIRELAGLERRYYRAKGLIHGTYKPDKTLDYVNETMASSMAKSLKELINGRDYEAETRNRGDEMQSIKQRALRGTVRELRHLKSIRSSCQIEEYLLQKSTSRDDDGEASHVPPEPPKPKRKYNKKHPRWNKTKKKNDLYDSDSDTNDMDFKLALKNDSDTVIPENRTEEADMISENNNNVDKPQNDVMVEIELNKIPMEINSESAENSYIEIEIIDHYENGQENTTICEENTRNDCNGDTLPDEIIKSTKKGKGCGKKSKPVETKLAYIQKCSKNHENVTESTQSEPAREKCRNEDTCKQKTEDTKPSHKNLESEKCKVIRRRLKLDKLSDPHTDESLKTEERKVLKKTILKSKLKRLGILPVADMNDPNTDMVPKKKRKPA